MNNNHPRLDIGAEVVFTTADKKTVKAVITQLYGEHSVRLDFSSGKDRIDEAIAEYSAGGEPGTFKFPASAAASAKTEK